jgi:phosphoenolpyruvate synthase/pyruvate phosphate dikinase
MRSYVLGLQDVDITNIAIVGGKGANLGEVVRIEGVHVPRGFCVTAEAFQKVLGGTPTIHELLDQLALLAVGDRQKIRELSSEMRRVIEGAAVPEEIAEEITRRLAELGENDAYAVRSSATAEDLPAASFAGQQDTYLNIIGREAILKHIGKCWASLFTERAIIYRLQNGFDHRKVYLAVVVQKMVFPQAAGIMFTADPVTSNRKVISVDAGFGLGEALVAGLVNPDVYKVRDGKVLEKKIANKMLAMYSLAEGGTQERAIEPALQNRQVLADGQILQLAQIGRTIEVHFGRPQDIEWCLAGDTFYVVQSRPITTLYPIPDANDQENRVYVSVAHQQMMTDAIKPLGLSFFLLTTPAPMRRAGGRLFVDVTNGLASPASRDNLLDVLGQSFPPTRDALAAIVARGDFIKSLPDDGKKLRPIKSNKGMTAAEIQAQAPSDPAVVAGLIAKSQAGLEELKRTIQTKSGTDLFDFIEESISQLQKNLADPQSMSVILAAINAALWINEKMKEWLGETNAVDTLSQSVPNNVTAEMGLELLDVADVIRPYPEVVSYLQHVQDDNFLDGLAKLDGGQEAHGAICAYLDRYGMRCAGEIDITKPRWGEKPATLLPLILGNINNFEPGAGKRRFELGQQEAQNKEQEVLGRLQRLPDGELKVEETKRMIDLVRNFAGYREYPKYSMISYYFVYKLALLKEAEQLVQAGVVLEKEDIYYLAFEELREAVRTQQLDYQVITSREDEYKLYDKLSPPRVITSEGEIFTGELKRGDLPAGAIAGLPVSTGSVEGRARVILKMEDADLEDGDILVTSFTDPSWTPLFVAIKGLVTEVGGLMTHGAVIAREYGIPAVVGVDNATRLIADGQRIRVHGTEGYVEILADRTAVPAG